MNRRNHFDYDSDPESNENDHDARYYGPDHKSEDGDVDTWQEDEDEEFLKAEGDYSNLQCEDGDDSHENNSKDEDDVGEDSDEEEDSDDEEEYDSTYYSDDEYNDGNEEDSFYDNPANWHTRYYGYANS